MDTTDKVAKPKPQKIEAPSTRVFECLLLAIAFVFFCLHGVHLRADFPNYSPWMDWAKYTDEGWYGDAAIRHFQRGHWYVPGDFNPAAALPVLPLVEFLVFRFTGVSIVAARALTVGIFGLILLASWLLLRRAMLPRQFPKLPKPSLAPAIAVLLLSVNPFCYVFTRLAILEPLLILLTLLALLVITYIGEPKAEVLNRKWGASDVAAVVPSVALGLILPLMVLTKTTAIFLLPAVMWMLFARANYRLRSFVRLAAPPFVLGVVVWMGYYGFIVHPHFLSDYRYLFSANAYTGVTSSDALSVFYNVFIDGLWIGHTLYLLALLCAVAVPLLVPGIRRNPLICSLLLWVLGYTLFLAYHNNLQPRYYLVLAIPAALLVAVAVDAVWNHLELLSAWHRLAAMTVAGLLVFTVIDDACQTVGYVRTPEYTFSEAANQIHAIVAADKGHNSLILSISGSEISLMTGLPSICDDFGTMDLIDRVRTYRPGWYVTWNDVEDDKMDALTPFYHLERIASFPAMDDPERNLLILYRLDPVQPTTPRRRHLRPVPRLLQTNFGQQPTVVQLKH